MTKQKAKILVYILVSFFMITTSIVSAASYIEKEYTFMSDSAGNLKYDFKSEIKENGKIYKVDEKSAKYEVLKDNKVSITKKGSISHFKEEIEENGIKYKLDRDSLKNQKKTTKTEVYKSKSEVKNEIKYNNETLKLSSIKEKKIRENINLPARFYGYPNSKIYRFNNRDIEVNDKPIWHGYEKDIADYLKLKGDYQISAGRFTTGFVKQGNIYRRDALYPAIRTNTVYEATYENEAKAVYSGIDTSKKVQAKVTVKYNFHKKVQNTAYIKIIAGVVIAIAIASLIFILLKKKKGTGDEG